MHLILLALTATASQSAAAEDVPTLKRILATATPAQRFDSATRRQLDALAQQVAEPGLRKKAQQLVLDLEPACVLQARVRFLQEEVKRLKGKSVIEPGGPDWLLPLVGAEALAVFNRLTEIELNEHTDGHAERQARPKEEAVSDDWLKNLAGLPDLTRLELSGTAISDAGLAPLGTLTRLERLNVCLTRVTDAGLKHLAGLTNLRRLVICSTKVTGSGVADISDWPRIESINLHSCPVSDEGLAAIRRFKNLQRLEIVHSRVTDAGLQHLGELTNLRQLHVASHGVTRHGLAFVEKLTRLEQLDLYEELASNEGLVQAGKLTQLKILNLYAGPVDDAGLAPLRRLTNLEELTLGGLGKVTDAAVDHLVGLRRLKQLKVNGTRITAAGLKRLRDALPATQIASDKVGADQGPRFKVPPGFVVERIAGPPLVRYPLFAAFDERGRLYVAEGTGTNLTGAELAKKKLGRVLLLEDRDGDGIFDTSTVFADQLVFPQGILWHDGAVYTASHPSFWRLEDTTGRGTADRREELLTGFRFNGNGCDIHGPFLGPDGRLYWTDGRHGYKVTTRDGQALEGLASRVWRCRTDGTEVERLAGGGFDNPVELAFTPEGDILGTMDQGPGDALLHFVEGGVYPMEHACLREFARTGPLLGAMRTYPAALPAGLCGLMRYRSSALGREYQDTLFTTHYVQHKIVQSILTRDGATFRAEDRDFLTSTDPDVRLTDILEDADGSLLFVDMGGWFTYGFPGNPLPRPEVLGAIYRIRRTDAPAVADPWGKALRLPTCSVVELMGLLDDARPRVRDQVVALLARRSSAAVPGLAAVLRERQPSLLARRNAVWSLCRMESPEARTALRPALTDPAASVRQAAVHALGMQRDAGAVPALRAMILREEPPLRLKAAEALGRIGDREAVPDLLSSLRQGAERFLEHALIFALIRIQDRAGTLAALADRNPRVRRAGLVALDQMPGGGLTRELVVPLLDTDDADLQQAALAVISKHEGWARATLGLLRGWLGSASRTPDQEQALTGALLAFSAQQEVQDLVAERFAEANTAAATKVLLLSVLGRCGLEPLPPMWQGLLRQALTQDVVAVQREAIAVIKLRSLAQFDAPLAELSRNETLPVEVRVAALECLAGRRPQTEAAAFALLTRHLSEQTDPLLRLAAARTLGASTLDADQLRELARHLPGASSLVLRLLLPAFARCQDAAVGKELATALQRSAGADALSLAEFDQATRGFPAEVRALTQELRAKLQQRQHQQAAYLGELSVAVGKLPGSAAAGRDVFFSRKLGCYGCHRAAGQGGNVGPDLSRVGRFRTRAELLESLVFPSLVIAPECRTYTITTRDGKVAAGLVVRESAEALHLRSADLAELRIARRDIEEIAPANISLMPDGLDRTMSRQEIADLLEFLVQQQ